VTHEYTILTGGVIHAGEPRPRHTALAWAAGTVLAVGDDASVLAISRGDSRHVDLGGVVVRPLAGGDLEPGDPADFEIRDAAGVTTRAIVRGGHVVEGEFPGIEPR
jgi:hypothetical protein